MTPNSTHVRLIAQSDPYAKWARKYPVDASKITRRLAGERTTEPGSRFGAGLARAIVGPPHMPDVKAHVQLVVNSEPYQQWAAYRTSSGAYPHRTDHNKVMRRLAGEKTTEPSSALAKGLARLLYQPVRPPVPDDPPPPPPDDPTWPPNKGFLHDTFKLDTVFTRSLSSFAGLVRNEARQHGWQAIAVQLDHAYYVDDNERELALIRSRLASEGWKKIVGWATYGYGDMSVFDEGRRQSEIAKRTGVDAWIANGEFWAEFDNYWKTSAWIDGWLSAGGGGGIPVACSCLSSETPNWARFFDYQSFIDRLPGSGIFPQVYGATYPAYTVYNALETLKRGNVPPNRVGLTFDVIEGQGPFADYRTWGGVRQIWTGDDARSGTFAALAR